MALLYNQPSKSNVKLFELGWLEQQIENERLITAAQLAEYTARTASLASSEAPIANPVSTNTGKLPGEVLKVTGGYPGGDKTEIHNVFTDKFNPKNLYKFRRFAEELRAERKKR